MPKTIYVACVGPSLCVKGGVSRVMELIGAHLPEHISVRFIATFNRYTGYEGATRSDQGSRLAQACVFLLAFVQTLFRAAARGTIFHVLLGPGKPAAQGSPLRNASHPAMPVLSAFSHGGHQSVFPLATGGRQAADVLRYSGAGTG